MKEVEQKRVRHFHFGVRTQEGGAIPEHAQDTRKVG